MKFFKQMFKKSKKAGYISFNNDAKKQVETARAADEIRVIQNDHDYL